MSKRHETSRRRTYGRRQHQIHERAERPVRFLGWVEVGLTEGIPEQIATDRYGGSEAGNWILTPRIG